MANAPNDSQDERGQAEPERAFWTGWLHEARTGLQVVLGRTQLLRRHLHGAEPLAPTEIHATLQLVEQTTQALAAHLDRAEAHLTGRAQDADEGGRPPSRS